MPTNLDRVQVLLQPDTYARVRTIAKGDRRSASAMCAELVEVALKLPKYRDMYELACETVGEVPARPDPRLARRQEGLRSSEGLSAAGAELLNKEKDVIEGTGLDKLTPERLAELQKLLKLLEVMNG